MEKMTDRELMIELMKRSSMSFMKHRLEEGDNPVDHDRCEKVAHNMIAIVPNNLARGMVDDLANHARLIYGAYMEYLNETNEEYYEMLVKVAYTNYDNDT